jgi:membrane protein
MTNIKQALKNFFIYDGLDAAAVLSFSTIFATVPILTIAFGIFSLSPYFAELEVYLEEFLFAQLVPQNYEVAVEYIRKFIHSAKGISGFSIIFLVIAAMMLFYSLDVKINLLYGSEKRRHFAKGLIIYLVTLILGPLLLAVSLFISSYISKQELFVFIPMGALFISALPIILSAVGLALIFVVIPTISPKFINALKSGFLAAFLLEVVKSAMLIYISYFPMYEIIYGAFAMALLFILWVYLSWIIILFGVSFCRVLEDNKCLVVSSNKTE